MDHKLVANFVEVNCGATTDFASVVNVQPADEKLDDKKDRLFVVKGRYDISLTWTGPTSLLIRCPGCRRENIYREVTIDGDIDVTYDFTPESRR